MRFGLWGLMAGGALMAGPATAQGARTIYFYNSALGTPAPSMSLAKLGAWGNGWAKTSRTMDFDGAPVLEVTTRNLNEGARFDLPTAVDVTPYQQNGFIRLRVRFKDASLAPVGGGMAPPPAPGPGIAMPAAPVPNFRPATPAAQPGDDGTVPGGFIPPGMRLPQWRGAGQMGALPALGTGGGFPALPGPDAAAPPAAPAQSTPIKILQLTLVREHGITTGRIPINLDTQQAGDDGWRLLVLPVKSMSSTPDASGAVQRVVITADAQDTFYMAQSALVLETQQMQVSIRRPNEEPGTQQAEITMKPGPLSLVADVEAGAADPSIEWNFDADNVGNLPAPLFGGGPDPAAAGAVTPATPPTPAPQTTIVGPNGQTVKPPPTRVGAVPPEAMGNAGTPAPTGPRVDARGLTATFTYPNEEQNYRVEVTVRDRSGQKPPVTAQVLVHVRG